MPPLFRYRFVDTGTIFTGDTRVREAGVADSPTTLFSNELACDVGETCWGENEPLAVLDHHRLTRFPSASAAVLHKARLIRQKFANCQNVVWLVTHRLPDFDAFCSMYLARWLIADSAAVEVDFEGYGLHPEGAIDVPDRQGINWLSLKAGEIRPEHRWPFLLAGYASMLSMRRRISCPRPRELRSVLYAALKRGRDYLSATSGATDLFDEARTAILQCQLNPVFDSVLERSVQFAPELAMLDREAEAYARDLRRARKAIVYMPEAEAPSPDFFRRPRKLTDPAEIDGEQLPLAETFRIPADGIYLRDPECALFNEWARVDVESSALGAGFEFTAIAYSNRRPEAEMNRSEYVFSIDPERANGRHLYTVWSRLQTKEVEALRTHRELSLTGVEASSGTRSSGALATVRSDPWIGGQIQSSTLVESPRRGTLIHPSGVRSDLRDDAVAEGVRTELEGSIFASASLVSGPQVTITDFSAVHEQQDYAPIRVNLDEPHQLTPPAHGYLRFAGITLRTDVPITSARLGQRLSRQIAETLWQSLYPETPGETPDLFEQEHLLVRADSVSVWGDRGIAIAHKPGLHVGQSFADGSGREEFRNFTVLVQLLREMNYLTSREDSSQSADEVRETRAMASQAEELARRAMQMQQTLALPDQEILRRFSKVIRFEELAGKLRDFNQLVGERLRRQMTAEESRRGEKRSEAVAQVQGRLEWFRVLLVGFLALASVALTVPHLPLDSNGRNLLAWFGSPMVLIIAAWLRAPWKTQRLSRAEARNLPDPFTIVMLLLWVALWFATALSATNGPTQ